MDKTIRLFQQDPYIRYCNSRITSVVTGEIAALVLDRTIFFPEGGGQPSDLGCITGEFGKLELKYVFEKDGIIYHQFRTDSQVAPVPALLSREKIAGASVLCELDWDRRFCNMQRHCGEHILSAVFYELYGGVNRGFHMGEDYMTIDISFEEKPEFRQMTDEMFFKAEWESNRMVWDDLPVSTRYFERKEEAEGLPMRKALAIEKDIVLVCVGDESNAAGCVACCGTHPRRTGEVGLIKLYRWDNYKGMARITFDAGAKALENCRAAAGLVNGLCVRYSSEPDTLIDRIDKREQKNSETRQELYDLKQAYLAEKSSEIGKEMSASGSTYVKRFELLKAEDLLALGKLLPELSGKLAVLISLKENTMILISDGTPDCGKIVKDNAAVWRGKGGGGKTGARAMFSAQEDMDCFIEFIQKAY